MTLTPGAYLKHCRQRAGLGIVDVAGKLPTEPRVAEHVRSDWIEQIEADVVPMTFNSVVALRRVFGFDLYVLERLAAIALGAKLQPPRLCRICACSQHDACRVPGGCSWVSADLCSACADPVPAGALA